LLINTFFTKNEKKKTENVYIVGSHRQFLQNIILFTCSVRLYMAKYIVL